MAGGLHRTQLAELARLGGLIEIAATMARIDSEMAKDSICRVGGNHLAVEFTIEPSCAETYDYWITNPL